MPLILTAEELRKVDAATLVEEGISSLQLMERAASAAASSIDQLIRKEERLRQSPIVFLCGRGNNGGDGWVMARLLAKLNYQVEVIDFVLGQPSSDNESNRLRAEKLPIFVHTLREGDPLPDIPEHAILIDAIFGTGLNRPVSGAWSNTIETVNLLPNQIWSIDLPSGLFTDQPTNSSAIRADRCFSLGYPKLAEFAAENAAYFGRVTRVDFKLSPATDLVSFPRELITSRQSKRWLKTRGQFGHKGTYGHALLVAGSYGSIGAATLAASATLRAGVGKLSCYLPGCGYQIMQVTVPEAMCMVDANDKMITTIPDPGPFTTIGIGPGIGQDVATAAALHKFLEVAAVPLVLDADALNILSKHPDWLDALPKNSVLTPHPKEFDRLFGEHDNAFARWDTQRAKAMALKCTILLKGGYTTVADHNGTMTFNPTGNPGMGTAGMGDVLTGIITGLIAQGYEPARAARLGCYLHGLAGDLGVNDATIYPGKSRVAGAEESLIASDVVENLGAAFTVLREG